MALLGLFVTQSYAQSKTITGVVKDQTGEPLIGVNVMEKGTTNGTITDVDGKYSVALTSRTPVLVFSYIGYLTQEIPVSGKIPAYLLHLWKSYDSAGYPLSC